MAGDQIKEWCFNGDEETLKQTHVTQPTIYTTTMAAYKALMAELEKEGIADKLEIDALAGFSLGEYSALTAAGAIDEISKGIDIVSRRGVLMQEAGLDEEGNAKGGMAAGIGDRRPERMAYWKGPTSIHLCRPSWRETRRPSRDSEGQPKQKASKPYHSVSALLSTVR